MDAEQNITWGDMEVRKYSTDNYHGYQLRACDEFWNLTPIEVAKIAHGCGPGSGFLEWIVPDNILGMSVKSACDIHDVECFFIETEEDEEEADKNFLHNMLEICLHTRGFFLIKILRRNIIFLYYSAVADIKQRKLRIWKTRALKIISSIYR